MTDIYKKLQDFITAHKLSKEAGGALEALFHQTREPASWPAEGEHTESAFISEMSLASAPGYAGGAVSVEMDFALVGEGRFRFERLLGVGGMGEVWRVWDHALRRSVAMKLIHGHLLGAAQAKARFAEEAQLGARLQHPNIPAVYEMGRLPDGRLFFTMREIQGETLTEALRGRLADRSEAGNLRAAVEILRRVCEAVGFAHELGVIHRDLKPANIVLGGSGEVLVIDWGLARSGERGEARARGLGGDAPDVGALMTKAGTVAGTPAFMAPEQARGAVDAIDAFTDVYALGAVLFAILVGRPPNVLGMVDRAREAEAALSEVDVPKELAQICAEAMAFEPNARHANGGVLAAALGAWLEGSRRRERALTLVEEARRLDSDATAKREEAATLGHRATAALEAIPRWAKESDKRESWAAQDRAASLEHRAAIHTVEAEQRLRAALTYVPELQSAHALLTERYLREHQDAESHRDQKALTRAELFLEEAARALLPSHPLKVRGARYLEGLGAVTLVTDPPGAEVLLHRFEAPHRRLEPVFVRSLGQTPLLAEPLPWGSYLLEIRKEGHHTVHYPVHIRRLEHWDGRPPEGGDPHPIHLPRQGQLEEGERYIPAGWFVAGGDPDAPAAGPAARIWADGFAIHRVQVTCSQYVAALNRLIDEGREEEALAHLPMPNPSGEVPLSKALGRDERGHFHLGVDELNNLWEPNWPIMMLNIFDCAAYAQWEGGWSGKSWRLPIDLEWEKAARGVDGRSFPWGSFHDPSWCHMRYSAEESRTLLDVGTYPLDRSPYGVRDTAGNVAEWCLRSREPDADGRIELVDMPLMDSEGQPMWSVRGGAWGSDVNYCRVSGRVYQSGRLRAYHASFRMLRPLDPHATPEDLENPALRVTGVRGRPVDPDPAG